MSESFVYCWTNHTNNKLYVGYHKGSVDDGYVCSSQSQMFWDDFNNPEMKWSRQIIAHGSAEECIKLEKSILQSLDLKEHYNNYGGYGIVFTDEVRKKMSISMMGKNKGRKRSLEAIEKQKESLKKWFENEDSTERAKKISDSLKGKPKTEETKKKMSLAKQGYVPWNAGQKMEKIKCPHCDKTGDKSNMKRWHFENCRNKQ